MCDEATHEPAVPQLSGMPGDRPFATLVANPWMRQPELVTQSGVPAYERRWIM